MIENEIYHCTIDNYGYHTIDRKKILKVPGSIKIEEPGDVTTVGRETTDWTNADTLRS